MKYTKTAERCASGDENLTENSTDTTCTSTRTLHSSSGVVSSVTEVSSPQQNKKAHKHSNIDTTQTGKRRHRREGGEKWNRCRRSSSNTANHFVFFTGTPVSVCVLINDNTSRTNHRQTLSPHLLFGTGNHQHGHRNG